MVFPGLGPGVSPTGPPREGSASSSARGPGLSCPSSVTKRREPATETGRTRVPEWSPCCHPLEEGERPNLLPSVPTVSADDPRHVLTTPRSQVGLGVSGVPPTGRPPRGLPSLVRPGVLWSPVRHYPYAPVSLSGTPEGLCRRVPRRPRSTPGGGRNPSVHKPNKSERRHEGCFGSGGGVCRVSVWAKTQRSKGSAVVTTTSDHRCTLGSGPSGLSH